MGLVPTHCSSDALSSIITGKRGTRLEWGGTAIPPALPHKNWLQEPISRAPDGMLAHITLTHQVP